jgi:hypothetical protein
MAMPATTTKAATRTIAICVVLTDDRFMTFLQFLIDSFDPNLRAVVARLFEAVPAHGFSTAFSTWPISFWIFPAIFSTMPLASNQKKVFCCTLPTV